MSRCECGGPLAVQLEGLLRCGWCGRGVVVPKGAAVGSTPTPPKGTAAEARAACAALAWAANGIAGEVDATDWGEARKRAKEARYFLDRIDRALTGGGS